MERRLDEIGVDQNIGVNEERLSVRHGRKYLRGVARDPVAKIRRDQPGNQAPRGGLSQPLWRRCVAAENR